VRACRIDRAERVPEHTVILILLNKREPLFVEHEDEPCVPFHEFFRADSEIVRHSEDVGF